MFQGIGGDGTVQWQTEPQLGADLYWKNLATGVASSYQEDSFYLVRLFDVWNDNGTPGDPGDDYLVASDQCEVCYFNAGSSTPVWTCVPYNKSDRTAVFVPASPDEPGKMACSEDGTTLAVAGAISGHTAVAVFHSDSAGPALIYEDPVGTYYPRQLRITSDGSTVLYSMAADLYRLNAETGVIEATYSLGASTDCFGISGDGSLVAYGFTSVKLAQWDGSQYNLAMSYGQSGYYAGAAAISEDGSAIYYGLYKNTYLSNRILRFQSGSSTPDWTYDYPTGSGGYQDVVSWMDCSSDGRYLAVSSWGCENGGGDELEVLDDQAPSAPIFTIDTPGSMWYTDIAPDGSWVSAAGKHVHANQMGSGADVYFADPLTVGIDVPQTGTRLGLRLSPNPCCGTASARFDLPHAGGTMLDVYDITGRKVHHTAFEDMAGGENSVQLSSDLPSGLYIVTLTFDGTVESGKLLISR